jgi:hypothetical protein
MPTRLFSYAGIGSHSFSPRTERYDLMQCHPLRFLQASASGTTLCEELPPAVAPSARNPKAVHGANEEGCSACLYTGMAVCTGVSIYFVKLATDETGTLPKNRRFFWVCSAGWAVAGAYRWYLG